MYLFHFQESLVKIDVAIDPRVHKMIVGRRGASIRKIMQDYKVDIKMPRDGDDKVIVSTCFQKIHNKKILKFPKITKIYPNDATYLLLLSSML